jgi:hypothetical protein
VTEFETRTCVACESESDPTVEDITYPIPGGKIIATFCSDTCRDRHKRRVEENDLPSPYAQIKRRLQEADVDVELAENGEIEYHELWTPQK